VATVGQEQSVKTIADWLGRTKWTERVQLDRFKKGGEEALAYRQYLLHWRDGNVRRPLAIRPDSAYTDGFLAVLSDVVQGVPSKLITIGPAILSALAFGTIGPLRAADDEDALQALVAVGPTSGAVL
jgi:hypothetical protein